MTDTALEKRKYNDIHKIAVSLEKIEQHLSTIAESYKPIYVDFSTGVAQVDDGK